MRRHVQEIYVRTDRFYDATQVTIAFPLQLQIVSRGKETSVRGDLLFIDFVLPLFVAMEVVFIVPRHVSMRNVC